MYVAEVGFGLGLLLDSNVLLSLIFTNLEYLFSVSWVMVRLAALLSFSYWTSDYTTDDDTCQDCSDVLELHLCNEIVSLLIGIATC